jgi:transcriptional regulator with GAF, ATPase, and Fis domain
MTARTSAQALADVASALVEDHEITDLLARLVSDCAGLIPADAAALLVRTADGGFELLSATSHRVDELELYHAQRESGPAVEAARTGERTSAVGGEAIEARWDGIGTEIVQAGFHAVHAFPMHWRGHAIGGLNLFSVAANELSPQSAVLAQSFADFATLAIVQPMVLGDEDLAQRVTEALEGRVVVEQAKGVLAHQLGLEMADAYDELVARASLDGHSLARVAQNVVRAAQER